MRPITDWEGYYITESGEIYSDKYGDIRLRKTYVNCRGYEFVMMRKNGKTKGKTIHRLVAQTFIPNPKNLPEVDHIDRNKLNNNVENLRWCSRSENIRNRDPYSEEHKEQIRKTSSLKKRNSKGQYIN